MSEPFLGEIRLCSFTFAPRDWAMCNGQLLPINQNQALFSLMGTMYGGDGRVNFALPDLRGRTPIHMGNGFTQGQNGGEQAHTLSIAEIPTHTHTVYGANLDATADMPASDKVLGKASIDMYRSPTSPVAMLPQTVSNTGGSQAHTNMQPYLVLTFCVALIGIFPSQT